MLRRVMQLRCRRASDTFVYLYRVFGYLHGISKCRLLLSCFRISSWYLEVSIIIIYRVFGYLHGISKCRSLLLLFAIPLSILWPRTDEYHVFSDIWNTVSRSVNERYLRVSLWFIYERYVRVSMVVFELPKSGNFELSFSGTYEYPPVIHYIGIYSNNTGKIMENV